MHAVKLLYTTDFTVMLFENNIHLSWGGLMTVSHWASKPGSPCNTLPVSDNKNIEMSIIIINLCYEND